MFLKYLEPIFKPYRMMRNYIVSVRTTRGNILAEARRVKSFGNIAKGKVAQAKGQVAKVQGQAQQAQGQAAQLQGQAAQLQGQVQGQIPGRAPMPGQPAPQAQARGPGQMPRGQMSPGQMPANMPVAMNPNPPIKTVGFFRRRKICTQCSSELDKTWDSCPYCAQAAQSGQPAATAPKANKTQAFMVEGGGSTRQLLAWLVPIDGPQRGELYTLSQQSTVGTEPTCNVVLTDQYMSTKHAEVKVEKGAWIVRDLGSTNGTYVNDQRISQRELVDGDFIRFGQSVTKFKSL
ncbi:MAG TPA: FHA domain-containing protein [Haliangium sp.]|nr:FHA domain-containing protein [Haliangium sp.]